MMQHEKAVIRGVIRLSKVRPEKLSQIIQAVPDHIRLLGTPVRVNGDHNRYTLEVAFEYGPVWGCYPYDIRRALHRARERSGSQAELMIDHYTRTVLERR
jgi:hypothetical protein